MAFELNVFLSILAGIIAIGFLADLFFTKTQIPDMLWLMLIGVILGPVATAFGYSTISRETMISIAPAFSAIALLMILFEGGLQMDLFRLIRASGKAGKILFSTMFLSVAVVTGISMLILNLGVLEAFLLAAIVGGTSSSIVVPIISRLEISEETKAILNIESLSTDPIVLIVALVTIDAILKATGVGQFGEITTSVLKAFSVSIVVGIASGVFWAHFLDKIQQFKYHYMLTLAYLFMMYVLGEALGGSGTIVAFTVGLMFSNTRHIREMFKMRKKLTGLTSQTKDLNSYITFFVRTFFFVFLGMLISFENPYMFAYGATIGVILLIVRAITIKLITKKEETTQRERGIMTYMYPRGLAAAVMATLPFISGITAAKPFADIVFAVIATTAILTTIGVARADKLPNK